MGKQTCILFLTLLVRFQETTHLPFLLHLPLLPWAAFSDNITLHTGAKLLPILYSLRKGDSHRKRYSLAAPLVNGSRIASSRLKKWIGFDDGRGSLASGIKNEPFQSLNLFLHGVLSCCCLSRKRKSI